MTTIDEPGGGPGFRGRIAPGLSPGLDVSGGKLGCIMGIQVFYGLAVLRDQGIEIDQPPDTLGPPFRHAGNNGAAVTVTDQKDIVEAFEFEHVDDIGYVGVQIDVRP